MSDYWMPYEEYCDMVSANAQAQHRVYLKSNEWKEKREIIMKRDKGLCQDCLKVGELVIKYLHKHLSWLKDLEIDLMISIKASQVHHLTYDTIHTSQEIGDCISLCGSCHRIKHFGLRFDVDKKSKLRFDRILKIMHNKILNHPKMIEIAKKQHDDFMKPITMKPNDWLDEQINEVENGNN